MKKSIIAAGAASAVLAAMPVLGVFAEGPIDVTSNGVKDTVTLGITESCTMTVPENTSEIDATNDIYGTAVSLSTITPGNYSIEGAGTEMTIVCNSTDGWNLKAQAVDMSRTDNKYSIPFGTLADSGQTQSRWSAKVAVSNGDAVIAGGAGAYSTTTVNTSATTIVVRNAVQEGQGGAAIATDGVTITPSYKAYAQADQAEGEYSGSITYTFIAATN